MVANTQAVGSSLATSEDQRDYRCSRGSDQRFLLAHLSDPWLTMNEQGYSESAQVMINTSATDSTKNAQFRYIDQFKSFLTDAGCSSSFSQVEIINFLAEKFTFSLPEFEAARTAISTTLWMRMGEDITQGIHFKRQSHGATNLKP
jgi:hypothetical protein